MNALSIQVPYQIFADSDGTPLDNGYVWIGTTNLDPRTNPINVYFDAALTQVAPNPLRTINGYVYNAGSPAQLYIDGVNFSIRVEDKKSVLVYSFPSGSGISPNADGVVYLPAGTGAVATTVQGKLRESVSVFDFMTPVQIADVQSGAASLDVTVAIQDAINHCMHQYDPTQTTHDGNAWQFKGIQKTLFIPNGIYKITSTLNVSFRNEIEIAGESMFGAVIRWQGAVDGMIIDARCSNYVKFHNFTIDGSHKALTFIHCAGNGVNAPSSKGNVTGNYFGHLYFWNQKGNLVVPYVDYSDQYDPLTAMLNTISIDNPSTYYNSMDDSVIEFCRFAPNSLNNFYAIGLSSSANVIRECSFFSCNGILAYNGAQFWMGDCIASLSAPQVQDSQHNHALIKFNYASGGGSRFTDIELSHCYLEGLDYYGNGHSVKLAYWAQGNVVNPEDEGVLNFLVTGGLYAGTAKVGGIYTYIDIQARRRANIKLINASLQGPAKLYIYAPDSSVEISDQSFQLAGFAQDSQTWQISSANSISHKYQTPEFQVEGAITPDVTVTVGTTDIPGQLKFISVDEALEFVSDCKGTVLIYLEENDTVTRGGSLNGNVFIALQGHTLNINSKLLNRGSLTILNSFSTGVRNGAIVSTSKYLTNLGSLTIKNCYLNNAVTNENGVLSMVNIGFEGTADSVINNGAGRVMIDSVTCAFGGSGYVVNLGQKYGDVVIKNIYGAIPSTGLWMRGTRLEIEPSMGFPSQYWATSDGVGTAANWGHSGNLV